MKRWFVAQVFAGYEDHIKADLQRRIVEENKQEFFGDILIPSAKVKQFLEVSSQEPLEQQLFPGYLLVEMEERPETSRLVATTPRVMRLLGTLSSKEMERISSQMKGEVAVVKPKSEFFTGSEVEIVEGPFSGFIGIIDKIEAENEKLVVMVSIFGRMTPVELRFDQVKQ